MHRETLAGGVPAVVLHPGHISGPGWPVVTPGDLDPAVWTQLATGRPLALPDNGLGVLHHVSIDRAREVLGYAPRYSSLDALHEALTWLAAHGQADVGGQEF